MRDEFEMIIKKFGANQKYINLYTLADAHIGAKECNIEALKKWIKTVKEDKNGYCVIAGDMLNMGLKDSKTNIYEELYTTGVQKEVFYEMFKPISDKILGMISGNHERRSVKAVGFNPLYDIVCRWRVEDIYREDCCFIDINLGKGPNGKNINYCVALIHGASKGKHDKWTQSAENVDLFVSGHTHMNSTNIRSKLVVDKHNKQIKNIDYIQHVCTPFLSYGGYAMQGEYVPTNSPRYEVFVLSGKNKDIEIRNKAIQIK